MDQPRVLVVDDDAAIREVIVTILQEEGFAAVGAGEASEALDAARRDHPGLILLDRSLPGADGLNLARSLRAQDEATALVVCSGASDAEEWSREIGADAVLSKPFDLDDLLGVVRECCGTAPRS